jgi:hypothetical protein
MRRWFQFSLKWLLVFPAIVGAVFAAFFAGQADGRRRENYRLRRIQDIQKELELYRYWGSGIGMNPAELEDPRPRLKQLRQELEDLDCDRSEIDWSEEWEWERQRRKTERLANEHVDVGTPPWVEDRRREEAAARKATTQNSGPQE